jgi:chromosome segregation ATPase
MILWDRNQITSRQFTAYLYKSDYFRIVAPYLLRKKYNRLVAMVIEYLRRANKFRTTEKDSPMKQNPDKIGLRLAMVQKDLSEQEAKYYKLKERLDTLKSEYRQLLNIYHNLEEPDDYFEDELQEYDYIIPALQSELDELKAELEHYNVKLKHNPRKRNSASSLGSIALAGLAGYWLGKK